MLVSLASSLPFRDHFIALVGGWQRLFHIASDPYRPERHYMRGPGPACRARQRRELVGL
jgi:hypothetical protein